MRCCGDSRRVIQTNGALDIVVNIFHHRPNSEITKCV